MRLNLWKFMKISVFIPRQLLYKLKIFGKWKMYGRLEKFEDYEVRSNGDFGAFHG